MEFTQEEKELISELIEDEIIQNLDYQTPYDEWLESDGEADVDTDKVIKYQLALSIKGKMEGF